MNRSPAPSLSMSGFNWLLLIVLSLLWGAAFFFNKLVVIEIPPLTGALGRVGIAALLLIVLSRATGVSLEGPLRAWPAFLLLGLLHNVLPFSLILWGQQHIASGLASILNATTPLFTILVAHFATSDDKLTGARVAGIVVGFMGVVIMIAPDLRQAMMRMSRRSSPACSRRSSTDLPVSMRGVSSAKNRLRSQPASFWRRH